MKYQFINYLNNFPQQKKEILVPIEEQKKLMQLCLKNISTNVFGVPIFDKLQKIVCLKRYYNYFEAEFSKFVWSNFIRKELKKNLMIFL